jgi:hypothetical protein
MPLAHRNLILWFDSPLGRSRSPDRRRPSCTVRRSAPSLVDLPGCHRPVPPASRRRRAPSRHWAPPCPRPLRRKGPRPSIPGGGALQAGERGRVCPPGRCAPSRGATHAPSSKDASTRDPRMVSIIFSHPSLSVTAHGSSRVRDPQVDSRWKRICWSDSDRLWYALDMVSSDSLEIATNKTDR